MASEQITYADEQAELPSALQDSEIARFGSEKNEGENHQRSAETAYSKILKVENLLVTITHGCRLREPGQSQILLCSVFAV